MLKGFIAYAILGKIHQEILPFKRKAIGPVWVLGKKVFEVLLVLVVVMFPERFPGPGFGWVNTL
jgi:hypothetical protein